MIVFSEMRISMALIKVNQECHGLRDMKIPDRLRAVGLRLASPKFEVHCDPFLAVGH